MNVIKQDAMDDKIKERCKTCENNACKSISTDWEAVEQQSSRSQPRWIENMSRIYRVDRKFLDGSRIHREAIKKNSRNLDGSRLR